MSLYTEEEVCVGCKFAEFHSCCNKFCRCSINCEDSVDHIRGECSYRRVEDDISPDSES